MRSSVGSAGRRLLASALTGLLIAQLCTACAKPRHPAAPGASATELPRRGGTLRIVADSDFDHLLTLSAYGTDSLEMVQMFARQLVSYPPVDDYDATTLVAPDLARELPTRDNGGISADGRTYRFHLRSGVLWNTTPARAVTAGDFVRTFQLLCNPVSPVGAPGYYTSTIAGMAEYCNAFTRAPATVAGIREFIARHELPGVRAIDDLTLEIRLLAPAADFLNLLAMPFTSPIPVEYLDYLPDSPEFRQHTLSNGPYAITHFVQGHELELERNPFWDAANDPLRPAYVDRISVRFGIDTELEQLQIEAGTADLSTAGMLTANEASLRQLHDPRVSLVPTGDHFGYMKFLVINLVGPNNNGALRKLKVRQALALAVDKQALAQLSGGPGGARPLDQAVASAVAGYRHIPGAASTGGGHGDPAAARRLLAEAGYPDGLSLKMAYPTSSSNPVEAQSLQASLRRAGFAVKLMPYNFGDFIGRLMPDVHNAERGEWDIALNNWLPDWFGRNNGRSVMTPLYDGRTVGHMSMNFGAYNSPVVNAAMDRALTATSLESAEAAWTEAAEQILRDVAIVPLIEKKVANMLSARLRNCVWSVLGDHCNYAAVWLADAPARRPER